MSALRSAAISQLRHLRPKGGGPPGGFFAEGTQTGPNGILFGETPLPAGVKRKMESWEAPTYMTIGAATLMLMFGYNAKPDTNIGTWAHAEALKRMKEAGEI